MARRGGRKGSRAARRDNRAKTAAKPTSDVVEAEFTEESAVTPSSSLARSRGGLGDLYDPGPIALLSDDAFAERLETLQLEQRRIEEIKRAILIEDEVGDGSGDYGIIQGTRKPSLYQSGAEKFNRLFGLRPVYRRERFEGDGEKTPNFRFLVECDLVDPEGNVVGSGGGTCSNFEVKYRYRNASLTCPSCGASEIRVSKFEDSPGFYCWKKPEQGHDGCGEQFGVNDQRIKTQTVGRKNNPDPHDVENTVQQMADKRAYVKATRTTHALSNTFTQDEAPPPGGGDAGAPDREKTDARAAKAGRKAASAPQIEAVRKKIVERAEHFKDAGISPAEIEKALCAGLGIENLEALQEVDVTPTVQAIFKWDPPVGEG